MPYMYVQPQAENLICEVRQPRKRVRLNRRLATFSPYPVKPAGPTAPARGLYDNWGWLGFHWQRHRKWKRCQCDAFPDLLRSSGTGSAIFSSVITGNRLQVLWSLSRSRKLRFNQWELRRRNRIILSSSLSLPRYLLQIGFLFFGKLTSLMSKKIFLISLTKTAKNGYLQTSKLNRWTILSNYYWILSYVLALQYYITRPGNK